MAAISTAIASKLDESNGAGSEISLSNTNDPDLVDEAVALLIGTSGGQHLEFGPADVQSKSNATTAATLEINRLGGDVDIGAKSGTGIVRLYNSASLTAFTGAGSLTIRHNSGTGEFLAFENNSGAREAFLSLSATQMLLRSEVHGADVHIQGEDTGGVNRNLVVGDPDGDVGLYHTGTEVARTLAAASGGLEVNNASTGGGFERVLTTSDIPGELLPVGTTTDSILRWSGSDWVEEDQVLITSLGALSAVSLQAYNGSENATFSVSVGSLSLVGSSVSTFINGLDTRQNAGFFLFNRAAAATDVNAYGQLWYHSTDHHLYFTDENGNDFQVTFDASSAYTPTNVTTDRSYDANSTTVAELADVVGTIISDLQAQNILG